MTGLEQVQQQQAAPAGMLGNQCSASSHLAWHSQPGSAWVLQIQVLQQVGRRCESQLIGIRLACLQASVWWVQTAAERPPCPLPVLLGM